MKDDAQKRVIQWLHERGLEEAARVMLDIAEPLWPLGAGLLWIAQPMLGVFVPRDTIADLAGLLDDPVAAAGLRDALTDADHGDDQDGSL